MPIPAGSGFALPADTLSLAYDGQLSRVRIIAAVSAAAVSVTVERSTNQITWAVVRGGSAVTPAAGAARLDDYEFAANRPNYYRVRAYTSGGREIGPALNANPYFETDTTGWVGSNATIARSTVQAHQGTASLLVSPDGVSAAGGANASARVAVTAGLDYLASLWARTTASVTLAPAVDWQTAVTGGAYINSGFVPPVAVAAGAWTGVSGILTAPATAAGGLMRARHSGTPTAAWWVDEVTLHALDAGPMLSGSITPSLDGVWLKSIARPFLNRPVTVRDFSEVGRPARGGVFEVVGRSLPVGVTDVRGSRRWSLQLRTDSPDEAESLDLLLAGGDVLLVHVPQDQGRISAVPGGYVWVGDTQEVTPPTSDLTMRVFELPCIQQAAPGPDVVGATSTWQTVLSTYPTWQAVMDARESWVDLLELVGDPTEVIVP